MSFCELAVQIREHFDAIAKNTPFCVANIIGGISQEKQERLLRKKPEIVVATPGRLWALSQEADENGE